MSQPNDSRDLITVDVPSRAVMAERPPEVVLAEAHKAAAALKDVLAQKVDKVVMNGQQYLEFEDWQTLGRFYGITAKEDGDPVYVEFGDVKGFKASMVALHDGVEISRATAYCMTDEEKWGSRPKYVWGYCTTDGGWSAEDPGTSMMIWIPRTDGRQGQVPKKERRLVGEESVPLFQLASMAQTRAAAKVLRNVLSWVAVLGGYKPTPAEELDAPNVREPAQQAPLTASQQANKEAEDGQYTETAPAAPGGAPDAAEAESPPWTEGDKQTILNIRRQLGDETPLQRFMTHADAEILIGSLNANLRSKNRTR